MAILPSILTLKPFSGLLGTTVDSGKGLVNKAFSVAKRSLKELASWIPCKRKSPGEEPLFFKPSVCTVLTSQDPAAILEFQSVLKKVGLLDQLQVETVDTGSRWEMHLRQSMNEFAILTEPHKETVAPYFAGRIFEDRSNKPLLQRLLVETAERHYRKIGTPRPVACDLSKVAHRSDREILEEIYLKKRFKGLFVGESHRHVSPKKFIFDNLEALRQLGVTTLFMEHFNYDTMQSYLDDYFNSESEEMHPVLAMNLSRYDQAYGLISPYTYTDVVRQAKKAGIRIVGIDTSLAYDLKDEDRRLKGMNYEAQKIIRHEQGSGKYVVLLGAAHSTNVDWQSKFTIPGIADMLQCPKIMVDDSDDGGTLSFGPTHVAFGDKILQDVHLLLERPKPLQH